MSKSTDRAPFPETQLPGFQPLQFGLSKAESQKSHRARLRLRFMKSGAGAMPDYELLELILFRAIPRQDVKPLAKHLLQVFGDFNHVISAPPSRLGDVPGVGDAVIQELKIVEAAAHRHTQTRILHRDVVSSWQDLIAYCKCAMAHLSTEQFRILFLDRKNCVIGDEPQAMGTVDHVPVYPREVARRALELGASAVILVHNHPSGDPEPSAADIDMTCRIDRALQALGIALHDHIVIGKSDPVSFRARGLL